MKKIIISLIVASVFLACVSTSDKSKEKTYEKGVVEIITTYPNIKFHTNLTYNDQNLITEVARAVNDYEEVKVECKYDDMNEASKFEYYYEGELSSYSTSTQREDSLLISQFEVLNDSIIEKSRDIYVYNENRDVTQVVRFKQDSLGEWRMGGSKYSLIWENGNLMKLKCFIPKESSDVDSLHSGVETENFMLKLADLSESIVHEGYELYYESEFTYDDKKNPFHNTSISHLIIVNKLNVSANNPITLKKSYVEGEVIDFVYDYEYNELEFPTMTDIKVTSNMEDLKKTSYTREFKY